MKLKNISIENYRFFKDKQLFDFTSDNKPKNILLYGENGSGKTSLYNAMVDFFFYYNNESKSIQELRDNKNIFCESEDEPKIEITFENGTSIGFKKDGLDKEDLKGSIEQVSKSKLFLTYKDIYALNNIFKKDISYKELREIFTILYFDDLDTKFKEFENTFEELSIKIEDIDTLVESYKKIKELIETFDETYTYELDPIEKKDTVPNVYDTVFYLDENLIDDLEVNVELIKKFFDIFENVFDIESMPILAEGYDSFALISRYQEIIEEVKTYTKEHDRYNDDSIICLDEEIHQGNSYLDDFSTNILMNSLISETFFKCESISQSINDEIFNKLNSSIEKINDILNFLDVNIEIEKVVKKPFITFSINNGLLQKEIRNIDFKILLSGVELKKHWSNLNESKLSALNFAIYLSSVLQKKPDIPLLVLDDLLISLDMSNRDKIIELLLDRSVDLNGNPNYFDNEYQIMIFTHDKAFFDMAKYKMDFQDTCNWNYLELYVDGENVKEKPYLKNHQTYHEKAVEYFNNREYDVASNFLRKEVEKQLHDYLGLKTLDGAIETAKIKDNYKKLEDCFAPLIIALKGFDNCEDIPAEIREEKCVIFAQKVKETLISLENIFSEDSFHDINGIKDRILNPQSHYDSSKPLYKKELEEALIIVKELGVFISANED